MADTLGPSAMANESNRRSGGGVDGRFPGALENRSGLANSDPRINGSTSAAYNAMGDNDVVGSFNGRSVTKKEADARAAGLQTPLGVGMNDIAGQQLTNYANVPIAQ